GSRSPRSTRPPGAARLDPEEAAEAREVIGEEPPEDREREPEHERARHPPHPPGHQLPRGEAEAEDDRGRDQEAVEPDQRHAPSGGRCALSREPPPRRSGPRPATRRTPRASSGTTRR